MSEGRRLPGRGARGTCAVLGLLLTPLLLVLIIGALSQLFLSDALHDSIGGDGGVLREERNAIAGDVAELAAEYHFSTEPVMALITADRLKEWNRESARSLTASVKTGRLQEVTNTFEPEGLAEVLRSDPAFAGDLDEQALTKRIREVSTRLSARLKERVCFLRDTMMRGAEKLANRLVHLPTLATLLQRLPVPIGLLCLLLSGLIVLLTARRAVLALRYIGAALVACGLLLLCLLALLLLLGIGPLMGEISPVLGRAFHLLTLWIGGSQALVALAVGCLGFFGMRLAERAAADDAA